MKDLPKRYLVDIPGEFCGEMIEYADYERLAARQQEQPDSEMPSTRFGELEADQKRLKFLMSTLNEPLEEWRKRIDQAMEAPFE